MLLELRDASFSYMRNTLLSKKVLHGINFSIDQGEFVSLIGPNGSGKSTLIQLLNGLLKPTTGQVLFEGKRVGDGVSPRLVRREVGLAFQSAENQLFEKTVFDDVAFGIKNFNLSSFEIENRVKVALEAVGLDYTSFKDRSPFSLSGGEMRKVAIAGVIAMKPKILILDEPTTGLDVQGRDEIVFHLKEFHRKGNITILLVSHDMDEVAALSDKVVVLSEGRIVLVGPPKQVFKEKETLCEVGLDLPQAALLSNALERKGFSLPSEAVSLDEVEKALLAQFAMSSGR